LPQLSSVSIHMTVPSSQSSQQVNRARCQPCNVHESTGNIRRKPQRELPAIANAPSARNLRRVKTKNRFTTRTPEGRELRQYSKEEEEAEQVQDLLRDIRTKLGHKTADARRRFRELDKDKNNCVAPDELRQALQDMNIQMSDKHFKALMELVGTEKKNVLSYSEFCAGLLPNNSLDAAHDPFEGKRMPHKATDVRPVMDKGQFQKTLQSLNAPLDAVPRLDMTRMFRSMDTERTGLVHVDDFQRGVMKVQPHLDDKLVAKLAKSADSEGTGMVNYMELIEGIKQHPPVSHVKNMQYIDTHRYSYPTREIRPSTRSDIVRMQQTRAQGTAHIYQDESSPAFASDQERFSRTDLTAKPIAIDSARYQARLQRIANNMQQLQVRVQEIERVKQQKNESIYNRIDNVNTKHDARTWQRRYQGQWDIPKIDYKHVMPLSVLSGQQM